MMTVTAWDSVNPLSIPSDAEAVFWYIDGRVSKWPVGALDRFSTPLKLSITTASHPDADINDCETGDDTPVQSAAWAHDRVSRGKIARIYSNLSTWPELLRLCNDIPVLWFVANPTGVPHILTGATATQYAWSSLNQTGGVPNVDLSLCDESFFTGGFGMLTDAEMSELANDVHALRVTLLEGGVSVDRTNAPDGGGIWLQTWIRNIASQSLSTGSGITAVLSGLAELRTTLGSSQPASAKEQSILDIVTRMEAALKTA